ncbi:MAG: hypothetical protein GEU77_18330 [Deltaproteobacteria bacterium]|nr:hypothetical protein [Deltaproteobacteria bacterium]
MNSSISHKTDPATLLRNEIEILFTQIRLMELYVKRAQASAAHEADHLRHQHRSELALLRAELEQKEQTLAARELKPTRNDFQIELHSLHAQLENIQHTLQERQSTIADLERQLQSRQSDLGDLLEQNQAEAIGQGYIDEIADLHRTIEAKDRLLHEHQTVFNSLQTDSNAVIDELRGQLDEQQALANQTDFKLKQAKSRITEILEQKTQLELVQKQTERLQSAQAEQMRAGARAEIELLESQLEQREVELQTKQTLFERHNEEAQKIHFEAEYMRQRIAEQEATIRRFAEQTSSVESERLRQAEAELTELRGMEQSFNARIQELQTQLAEKQALLENAIGPFGAVNRC